MQSLSRRHFTRTLLAGATATAATGYASTLTAGPHRTLVLGGGPAGGACALALKRARPGDAVVLVERDPTRLAPAARSAFTAPRAGITLDTLRDAGVEVMLDEATEIDWHAARLALFSGRSLAFDTLMLAPGTAPVPEDIPGLDAAAQHRWPAAWGSPRESARLSAALSALPEAGHVVLRLPADLSHPEAALGRALELAAWIAHHRPSARLSVLESAQASLAEAYEARAASQGIRARVDWHTARTGGRVLHLDAPNGMIETSGGVLQADVVNFVPPRSAGHIALIGGLADASGWCPCDAQGRSTLRDGAVILGDARADAVRTKQAALHSASVALENGARTGFGIA